MTYNKIIFTKGTTQYKDLDISFKNNPNSGDLRVVTDDNAIKQSLKNIVYTLAGDRPFDPSFGGGIYHLLFEPLDELVKREIQRRLTESIVYYEPRINLDEIVVSGEVDQYTLDITIKYMIKNQSIPQSINIILNRTR